MSTCLPPPIPPCPSKTTHTHKKKQIIKQAREHKKKEESKIEGMYSNTQTTKKNKSNFGMPCLVSMPTCQNVSTSFFLIKSLGHQPYNLLYILPPPSLHSFLPPSITVLRPLSPSPLTILQCQQTTRATLSPSSSSLPAHPQRKIQDRGPQMNSAKGKTAAVSKPNQLA